MGNWGCVWRGKRNLNTDEYGIFGAGELVEMAETLRWSKELGKDRVVRVWKMGK